MPRVVSVWLERFATARLLAEGGGRAAGLAPERPLVLAAEGAGGPRILCLNPAASRAGLAAGGRLADARALVGSDLQVRPADTAGDQGALDRLALWATRYTPRVAPWGEAEGAHGFHLDVEGAAHLCGGEEALIDDLVRRLRGAGLSPRAALASTPGLAHGLARFGAGPALVPSGNEEAALAPLPVEALRLRPGTAPALRRVGLRRVGDLLGRPRAPLARRFGEELLRRLDQALGLAPDPLVPVAEPAAYRAERAFAGPVTVQAAVVAAAARLMRRLAPELERDGVGARALRLRLTRVDGAVAEVDLGLGTPTRDAAHVERLVALRLDRLGASLRAGHGWETLSLAVTRAEPLRPDQPALGERAGEGRAWAELLDRLRQQLGPGSVRRLRAEGSHVPERACAAVAADEGEGEPWPAWPADDVPLRPLLLLARPEPAEADAGPDGAPARLRWRRAAHEIVHAEGPERIAPEWWRGAGRTRDYYLVETREGRRLWLYRERDGEDPPAWFVHGLFA